MSAVRISSDSDLRKSENKAENSADFPMTGAEAENRDACVRIPMIGETRSLNLSNSVAVLVYEALRQQGFADMKLAGQLHRHSW